MPRGEKSTNTSKQKRQAEHIAGGYAERGTSGKEAKARATVNKQAGGGEKGGSGRGRAKNVSSSSKGGKKGARGSR